MTRRVQPELLDQLPPDDAAARGSRRDLRRINRLMGNAGALISGIRRLPPPVPHRPWTVVEAGAGDGTLAARVWDRLPPPPGGSRILLLDQVNVTEPQALNRLRARNWDPEVRVMRFEDWLTPPVSSRVDLVYANLFLHHFDSGALVSLLSQLAQRTASVVLVEPRRSAVALLGARMLRWVGCNAVTRHDAVRSVHAGFRGSELSEAWPRDGTWILQERAAGPFAHTFVARRREPR
ncbi:MAG: hypothetical protein JNL10_12385 [Verrucomicrobiales bacterium]|nr:hypothetical protein [Verrucomicrobiales bacterium]